MFHMSCMTHFVLSAGKGVRVGALLKLLLISWLLVGQASAQTPPANQKSPLVFRDVTEESGLLPSIGGLLAHGAGWGDVDASGFPSLYVGTFHQAGGTANKFYRNVGGKFVLDDQKQLQISTRANSGLFVDLTNSGRSDLYVTSMPITRGEITCVGPTLFRSDGQGKFTDISKGNGACPPEMAARSAAAFDFDGDGLLDLVVVEDGGYAQGHKASSRIFKNMGNYQFKDVSQEVGLPAGMAGYGVAAEDVNNDGWPDFFISGQWGMRLFLNDGKGHFREANELAGLFAPPSASEPAPAPAPAAAPGAKGKSSKAKAPAPRRNPADVSKQLGGGVPCGVAFGDVNRDGLIDMVIGQHYKTPWQTPIAIELFLNRGIKDGVPQFERVTEQAGLVPLPMKAPHVEIQDFDNDGWPDIYASMVKWDASGRPYPLIFRNQGVDKNGKSGLPKFHDDSLAANDFPNAEDRAPRSTNDFYTKVMNEGRVFYGAPGPTGDYNNDGRLDIFIGSYWLTKPSVLLKNETPGGHWVRIKLEAPSGVNRQGIGSRVSIYQAGRAGDAAALLGVQEIAAGYGYASSQVPQAHFGLGAVTECDIVVTLPHGKGQIVRKNVKADQVVTIKQ